MNTETGKKIEVAPYDTVDYLKSDAQCVAYFQAALEEGDPGLLAAALGDVMRARVGNISELARRVDMSRFGLYKALSTEGNPSFATVAEVARVLALNVVFAPAAVVVRARREVTQVISPGHGGTSQRGKSTSRQGRGVHAKRSAQRKK